MNLEDQLTNLKKAGEFLDSIENEGDKMILESARWQVLQRLVNLGDGSRLLNPESPFDMYFFLLVVNDLIKHKKMLIDLLNGDVEDWKEW